MKGEDVVRRRAIAYSSVKGFIKGEGCCYTHRYKLNPTFFSTTAGSGNGHKDSVIAVYLYIEYTDPLYV